MWILVVNFLVYHGLNVASGRLGRTLLPINGRSLVADLVSALRGALGHDDLTRYSAVKKFAYLIVIVDIALVVLSGLAVRRSVQFPLVRTLMGGYDKARVVHFVGMSALVALVPRSLLLMIRGR
jgi:thiosulfate reductase cytochrome b subunit